MAWVRAVATCGALVVLIAACPSRASAQTGLTERLGVQGIYSHQAGLVPPSDFAGQVVPELSLLVLGSRAQLRATYTLAATAHTTLPADLTNRVNLSSTFDLSKRTILLLSAEAGYTTVTNALIASQPSQTPVGAVPLTTGQLLTMKVAEATSWDASPVVRFGQAADATYITTLNAPAGTLLQSYLVNAVESLDRVWKADAVGIDLRGAYAESHVQPFPRVRLIPLALTPHWRHDISRTLTSSFAAGATYVFSPDPGTRPLLAPLALASFYYLLDTATFELLGSLGVQPNSYTAQLLYADQVTLRVSTPLSLEDHIVASGAIGYTHGTILDRARGAVQQPDFDSFIADAGITWSASNAVSFFARYQFLEQITAATALVTTPDIQRNTVIVGVQLVSRPDPIQVPTKFPQRVDRSDAPTSQ